DGGGIYNAGDLAIFDRRLRANEGGWGAGIGGAGTLTVERSVFTENWAYWSDGGGLFIGGVTRINNSCIFGNLAEGVGSGMLSFHSGSIDMTGNWWGASDGPSGDASGSGDSIVGNIDYSGWLTSAPSHCSFVVTPTPSLTPISSNTSTYTPSPTATPSPVLSFNPTDDAHVKSNSPNNNYGTLDHVRTRSVDEPFYNTYLKFNLSGISSPIQRATLRLFSYDGGPNGGSIYQVANTYQG